MPLSGTGPALGASLAVAAGSVDPAGIAAWSAIGTSLCAQLPALCTFIPTSGTPLVSAAGVVSGTGAFLVASGSAMGPGLASAAGSLDLVGQSSWAAIGAAITTWMTSTGIYASGLIGFVSGTATPGAVTGLGLSAFTSPLGTTLAVAAGSIDAVGIAKWTAIGIAIQSHLTANLQIAPSALVNPGTGGPITGTAIVS